MEEVDMEVGEDEHQEQQQLDLDSLLESHLLSSSDDDDTILPSMRCHRTVDEILLYHSSSSPSPSTSPPSPSTSHRSQQHLRHDAVLSSGSPKTLVPDHSSSETTSPKLLLHAQSLDISKVNSNSSDYTNNNLTSSRVSSSSELSSIASSGRAWFGGVRSNAKPGAALAAATAASRPIPSPHAAAIKSRRRDGSVGSLVLQRVLDDTSNRNVADAEVVSEEITYSNSKSGEAVEVFQSESHLPSLDGSDERGDNMNLKKLELSGEGSVNEDGIDERLSSTVADNIYQSVVDEDNTTFISVGLKADQVLNHEEYSGQRSSPFDPKIDVSLENGTTDLNLAENQPIANAENFQPMKALGKMDADKLDLALDATSEKQIWSGPTEDSDKRMIIDEETTALAGESNDQEEMLATQLKDGEDVDTGGDESSSQYDDVDMVEELTLQWESKRGTKMAQKRSRSSWKPLELAEELEKKQAFTGLHWEEGVASLPMRFEGVRRGSTPLGYFDVDSHNLITETISSQAFRREYGSPQVLAVHFNYIALGVSRGTIVVVPSKYSPHHADQMDPKMLMLGLPGDRSYVSVTSMCFNQQGDLLFAGYGDGRCIVWDMQRASALKVINEHKAPVVHMLYLGQDSQVTRQFNLVSGDTKGIVKLIRFSVVPLLHRISYSKPVKLLDESTSTVVCAAPLVSGDIHGGTIGPSQGNNAVSTGGIGSMMGGVVGGDSGWKLFEGSSTVEEAVVIFVTHQSALVAKVSPAIEVYAQLPKPDGVKDGAMPYAAWKYMEVSEEVTSETSERVALLVIVWDQKVQVAKLVKSELKVSAKWDLDTPAVGVAWLNDQMLVVLTSIGQLCLFSKDGILIHQTSFTMDGSREDDLISNHTYFTNKSGNPEKAYHNCVAVRGATMYILGPMHLAVSRLLPWKERVEVLQRAGDWMGALYMAMTFYDGQAQAVIDLPRNLKDVQKTVMPYLVQLLFAYVDEVFSYISVACGKPDEKLDLSFEQNKESNTEYSEAKEQYSRVGGVAVEFCLHINRTDILFDEIYTRFGKIKHQETFLELLEPYILKDMLGSLPPEIMQALVEHYSQRGWLQRVEQCVLHMDILSLDFNQVVRLCREHRLHGALIYLFNKGLNDFRTPLEELLVVLRNSQRENVPPLGYRILIYLKYCFEGLAFPPGHGSIPSARLPSLRKELVQYLLENSSAPHSWTVSSLSCVGVLTNLHQLLELDTESTLDVLRYALVEDEIPRTEDPCQDSNNFSGRSIDAENELVQKLVNILSDILDMSYFQTSSSANTDSCNSIESWPSKYDLEHILNFIAYYVACEKAMVRKDILNQIVEYLTSEVNSSPSVLQQTAHVVQRREMQLLGLLEVVPQAEWDAPYFLHLCNKAQFHQACGLIHALVHHYSAALDCYMKVLDEPIHAFSFIHEILQRLSDKESTSFRSAVISRIQDLVRVSREGTLFLVLYHFSAKSQQILSELHSHPESLFLYLKTILEVHSKGTLNFSCLRKFEILDFPCGRGARHQSDRIEAFMSCLLDFPKLVRSNSVHVTDEMTEQYVELLCRYERGSVLKFLETFESYRVDHCLRLCQEFGVLDAAAFLLERVGDVGSALLLHLSDLNHKFILLAETFEHESFDGNMMNFDTLLKKKEVNNILDTLHACIELCQRNSPRLDPHESEFLWFQLLDSFCEPLVDDSDSERDTSVALRDPPLGKQEGEGASKIKWKVSKSHESAYILRKLISMCIKEIVEGMIGYLRLPAIMLKLLADNGTQEFGDFRPTILGMLGTYDFERRILDTAKSLIEDDTYYTMSLLKKGASHGYAPHSLLCCLCNCILTRNASGPGIQVYSCGHATHLHCGHEENLSSVRGSAGCPICMPKMKAQQSKGKFVLSENGLVHTSSSRAQQIHGSAALHLHDGDSLENPHQISRFELLNNLQRDKTITQLENMPQLRLAPPSVYHEKVNKGMNLGRENSSISKMEKPMKGKAQRNNKVKGSSIRFPLKSNIFGKEKFIRQ